MGLRDLFSRWTKKEDERAVERAEEETRMTPEERAADSEDFEAKKDDLAAQSHPPGMEADDASSGDLDER
jgi:hypothetical protein